MLRLACLHLPFFALHASAYNVYDTRRDNNEQACHCLNAIEYNVTAINDVESVLHIKHSFFAGTLLWMPLYGVTTFADSLD